MFGSAMALSTFCLRFISWRTTWTFCSASFCLPPLNVHFAAVCLLQEIVDVPGDDIDNFFLQCFRFSNRHALAHSLNGPFSISAALLRDAFTERRRKILDLLPHHAFDFLTSAGDRMSRADVGSRRHRRDIGGHRDEYPGRAGPGAAGSHINHDRHRRAEQLFDDGSGGAQEPAWSVELDDQSARAARLWPGRCFHE